MNGTHINFYFGWIPKIIIIPILVFSVSNNQDVFSQSAEPKKTDSMLAVEALTKFRDAIISGDRIKAGEKLTRDAIIMQAGEQCDRETFIQKHIIPECKYVYTVNQSVDHRILRHREGLIWISSSYKVDVRHEDEETAHRKLAELAVLKQENGNWKIDMIHWSNCPRYPDPK